jgi:Flp pilus assembly protein TadG
MTSVTDHSQRGSVLVELALVMPVLVLLLVGSADFARVFYMSMAVSAAARTGAQFGASSLVNSANTSGMQTRAQAAAQADLGTVSAVASRTCYCFPDAPVATFAPGAAVACTTTCAAVNTHLVVTVSVTTTATFSMLAHYPGIPKTITISRTAEMRAQ